MPHQRAPSWTNEQAVIRFITGILEDLEAAEDYEFANLPWETYQAEPASSHYKSIERDAVHAAKRGDLSLLTGLLLSKHPLNEYPLIEGNPIRNALQADTWNLIVEFLTGQRNLRNGKPKGNRGRPPMADGDRRIKNPTHDATDEFDAIRGLLRCYYDKIASAENINTLARKMAADRANARSSASHVKAPTNENKINNLRRRSGKTGHKIR